jgi:hypothetical protein
VPALYADVQNKGAIDFVAIFRQTTKLHSFTIRDLFVTGVILQNTK